MATGQHIMPENLKKQLAVAVRNIQWSYAIFWAVSPTQPSVLVWGDGYYNGDIKTRKTNQAIELKADELGLQRSEQLRDLYESLSESDSSQQSRRSMASLSPEDLTDTEWYYLVCMSFVFDSIDGIPGRTLANEETLWLCHAHNAESKVFSRSLLAKSASVQTVVCFPYLGGVVELGTTDNVPEDLTLIQCVKSSLSECPYAIAKKLEHNSVIDPQILDNDFIQITDHKNLPMSSLDRTSTGFEFDPDHEPEDSFMVDGLDGLNGGGGGASQVQSWHFMDDELSNCIHQSLNSGDCVSQTFAERSKFAYNPRKLKVQETGICSRQGQEQNGNRTTSLDPRSNDFHYHGVLSTLFKSSHQLILGPNFENSERKSSFASWTKCGLKTRAEKAGAGESQKMVKRVLIGVPRMHQEELLDPEDEEQMNCVLSEKKGGEKLNERFMILKSIVPSISKADKVSILDDTIKYVQELERRVEELESCKDSTDATTKRKTMVEAGERTSACCGNTAMAGTLKNSLVKKRKMSNIEETEPETDEYPVWEDGLTDNLRIGLAGNEVVIDMRCGWREGVLLEIMDAVCSLSLDTHSVQSSTNDGILCLTIKCKHKGSKVATLGMIKRALQRVAWIC